MNKQDEIQELFETSKNTIEKSKSLGIIIEQVSSQIISCLQKKKKILFLYTKTFNSYFKIETYVC
jgi:phosphoheptose isomerase